MRPPECTGGNSPAGGGYPPTRAGFNEAAGIHRRKRGAHGYRPGAVFVASMRPPEFTGGNGGARYRARSGVRASMRPPEFTGGNHLSPKQSVDRRVRASMRPPEFTGGNIKAARVVE